MVAVSLRRSNSAVVVPVALGFAQFTLSTVVNVLESPVLSSWRITSVPFVSASAIESLVVSTASQVLPPSLVISSACPASKARAGSCCEGTTVPMFAVSLLA